jgi:hypothetical protein
MSVPASKRLITLAERNQSSPPSHGVSLEDIGRIQVTAEVTQDILTCLYDLDLSENFWGVWFCEGLAAARKIDDKLLDALVSQFPYLSRTSNPQTKAELVALLVMLGKRVPKFSEYMMQFLRDESASVRQSALMNSHTFLEETGIAPLVPFKDDPYITEVSMAGDLVYALRNEALARIEKMTGKSFGARQLSNVVDGGRSAYWRDWSDFLRWWNRGNKKVWWKHSFLR